MILKHISGFQRLALLVIVLLAVSLGFVAYLFGTAAPMQVPSLTQMLSEKSYSALEQQLNDLQKDYLNSQGSNHALADALTNLGRPGLVDTKQRLDDWVAAMPQSAFALATRGQYRHEVAWMYRGTNYWNKVPEKRRAQFMNNLNRSWDDLWAALKLNPDLGPARTRLVQSSHAKGDGQGATALYDEGYRRAPLDANLQAARLWGLQPKWGGSTGQIAEFLHLLEANSKTAEAKTLTNTMRALSLSDQADDVYNNEKQYQRLLLEAHQLAPKHSTILRKLGEFYLRKDNLPEAAQYLDAALQSNALDADIWAARARLKFKQNDRVGSTAAYTEAAELGDTGAMLRLVYIYMENFEGSVMNSSDGLAARRWAQLATAYNDDPTGQVLMGMIYEIGYGGEKIPEEALRFYSRAAAQGDGDGQARLGLMLWEGRGTAANRDKAVELWQAAAANDHAWAQQLLASHPH